MSVPEEGTVLKPCGSVKQPGAFREVVSNL